jgi:hypothetical protein
MAHFAEVDKNNIVLQVVVVNNEVLQDENGNEVEVKGADFLRELLGSTNAWYQTSYNSSIRKNFAAPGYFYDPVADVFYPPAPHASWVLDENHIWQPPVARPENTEPGTVVLWNEPTKSWITRQLN